MVINSTIHCLGIIGHCGQENIELRTIYHTSCTELKILHIVLCAVHLHFTNVVVDMGRSGNMCNIGIGDMFVFS